MLGALALVLALALLLAWPGAARAEVTDHAAWLFDPNRVVEIDFAVEPEALAQLDAEPEEYVPAKFTLRDGATTHPEMPVWLRLKGHGSFRTMAGKAAFKVKFNYVKGATFSGLKKLTLNNMVQDYTMAHETLSFELFRAVGLVAPRTGYALVRVNGVLYGLYLNLETPDDVSLPRWFASTGHLYEGGYEDDEDGNAIGFDVVPGHVGKFEVDEGDEEDLSDLEALVAAANVEVGDWSDAMAPVADLRQMTRYWAVERYIGHWDGYAGRIGWGATPNNFYLHSTDAGVFTMLPWGTDQTFDARLDFDEPGGLLFDRCLADADCRALYEAAKTELLATVSDLDLAARIDGLAALLAPCQALEDTWRREFSALNVVEALDLTRRFARERPDELADHLGVERPELPSGPAPAPGYQPCPELPAADPPQADSPAAPAKLRTPAPELLSAHLRGAVVVSRVRVSGPGRANQRVLVRRQGAWRSVCGESKVRMAAGVLVVRCALPRRVLRRLRESSLRFKVEIEFRPRGGGSWTWVRHLAAPRRPAG